MNNVTLQARLMLEQHDVIKVQGQEIGKLREQLQKMSAQLLNHAYVTQQLAASKAAQDHLEEVQ